MSLMLPMTTIPDGVSQVPGFIYTRGGSGALASGSGSAGPGNSASGAAIIGVSAKLLDVLVMGNDKVSAGPVAVGLDTAVRPSDASDLLLGRYQAVRWCSHGLTATW